MVEGGQLKPKLGSFVLYVMVEGEDGLGGVVDVRSAY